MFIAGTCQLVAFRRLGAHECVCGVGALGSGRAGFVARRGGVLFALVTLMRSLLAGLFWSEFFELQALSFARLFLNPSLFQSHHIPSRFSQ